MEKIFQNKNCQVLRRSTLLKFILINIYSSQNQALNIILPIHINVYFSDSLNLGQLTYLP